MTNEKLNVILATALDKAGSNRIVANRIMKRYALAQSLIIEEDFSEEDISVVLASTILYDFNDPNANPTDDPTKEFKPIVITNYITELLEELYLPTFEVSAIGSLVAMQKHGLKIENKLHRLLLDIQTIVLLDENPAPTQEELSQALESMTHDSAKLRLKLLFNMN